MSSKLSASSYTFHEMPAFSSVSPMVSHFQPGTGSVLSSTGGKPMLRPFEPEKRCSRFGSVQVKVLWKYWSPATKDS